MNLTLDSVTFEKSTDFVFYYVGEVIQAMIALLIYKLLTTKGSLDYYSIFHGSLVIGGITAVIEQIDPAFNRNIKSGAMMTIGGNLVKNMK